MVKAGLMITSVGLFFNLTLLDVYYEYKVYLCVHTPEGMIKWH